MLKKYLHSDFYSIIFKFNKKASIREVISVICFSGIIGIAIKFITLFDKWLYFPYYPNIFDSIFLILSAFYLFIERHI
jgi:hypothetical protein